MRAAGSVCHRWWHSPVLFLVISCVSKEIYNTGKEMHKRAGTTDVCLREHVGKRQSTHTHMHAHTHVGPAAHAMNGLPRHPGDDSWQMQHAATHCDSVLLRHSKDAYWHAHCSSKISPKPLMGMEKKNPVS